MIRSAYHGCIRQEIMTWLPFNYVQAWVVELTWLVGTWLLRQHKTCEDTLTRIGQRFRLKLNLRLILVLGQPQGSQL